MSRIGFKPEQEAIPDILPVIPTMDVVVFPHMIVPLLVLDEKIINGIQKSLQESKLILLLAAKNYVDSQGAIGTNDLYQIGTVASIMRLIKIPEGGIKILVQGVYKGFAKNIITDGNMLQAEISLLQTTNEDPESTAQTLKNIKFLAEKISSSGNFFSPDFHIILSKMNDPEKIADFILSHLNLNIKQAQELLEKQTQQELLEALYILLSQEIDVSEVQEKIKSNARESMNKAQKEFYLREQLRAIKQELGEDETEEIDQMREKLANLKVSEEIKTEINRQINRLERTAPDSLEATVTRNYLDWIFGMPWGTETSDNLDILNAKQVLEEDHYGLKDIKDRILDFISIKHLKTDGYAPILCFVGPPGTGKTSLGQSIAKSLNRTYARISLGGVKDEAEIRGHRRTYVGAMPGRFIQAIKKAGSCNPVIVIDELDKIGADFRGDPSAAMLEVLDPQQNKTFYDNYLGVPFDLSKVMFIATANTLESVSDPLRDRMEVIELSGYTFEEKLSIAQKHLMPKALKEIGLSDHHIPLDKVLLDDLIVNYTRESGVRQLERIIHKLYSKAARMYVEKKEIPQFASATIEHYLGPRKFLDDDIVLEDQIGISNGLAWTPYGGEMIKIEAVLMPGKGKLILTGQLGKVMQESAQAAHSYVRSHALEFDIDSKLFQSHDLHIHVPAGAIPKDGPSAGITILTAVLSAYTKCPIRSDCAMTGELNLAGQVMRIGGLKEKILAAKRHGLKRIIAPSTNQQDLFGLEDIIKDIDIIWVKNANEVIKQILPLLKPKEEKRKQR